jgi:hypothetical protein
MQKLYVLTQLQGNFIEHVQSVPTVVAGRKVGADDEARINVDVALLHFHGRGCTSGMG